MTPNESHAEKARLRDAAKAKSPIVTRRRALTMAFHRAIAAVQDAKSKTASSVLGAAAELKNVVKPPGPPHE